jgi:peptidoglycan/xylan/chitin deacetylase (PgdA/CDA1 family)
METRNVSEGERELRNMTLKSPSLTRRVTVSFFTTSSFSWAGKSVFALEPSLTRRGFLAGTTALMLSGRTAWADKPKKAQIAITFDLEMSRHYPKRGMTEWDYQKGNLNDETKTYSLNAARIAHERGAKMHFFCVGRVLEQSDAGWLKQIVDMGHPVGNHTYDHVNVWAKTPQQTQFRFQRSPWLIEGKSVEQILRENIRLTTVAMQERLGIAPDGFRTPGGSALALDGRKDLQQLVLDEGFTWVSSKYPHHDNTKQGQRPDETVFQSIVDAQDKAQPYIYPTGLIEIPMSPISDVGAFRTGYWKLAEFLHSIELCIEWAVEQQGVFDLLCHPSIMYVEDPEFQTINHICDLVDEYGDRAELADLNTIATTVKPPRKGRE